MHQIWKCKVSNISNRLRSKPLDKCACCLCLALPPSQVSLGRSTALRQRPRARVCAGRGVGCWERTVTPHSTSPLLLLSTISSTGDPSPWFGTWQIKWCPKKSQMRLMRFSFRKRGLSSSLGAGIESRAGAACPAGTLLWIFVFKWTPSLHGVPGKKNLQRGNESFCPL